MRKRLLTAVIVTVFIIPAGVGAEESVKPEGHKKDTVHELEDVVVTATHEVKALDAPASLSIITREELVQTGAKNVVEALVKIPGVDDSSTKRRTVVIRGNKSAMAGGPLVLIDGVAQKVGDYRYNEFNFLPISQIERIEVLRSAGIAAGPGAARGVINIITRRSIEEGGHGELSASHGSWNTSDLNASLYGKKSQWDYLLNAGKYHTDGYEEEEENRASLLARAGYNLSEHTRIGFTVKHVDYDQETVEGFGKKQWQLENYRREQHFPKSETDSDLIWHNEKEQENTTLSFDFSHKNQSYFVQSSFSWTGDEEEFRRLKDLYDRPSSVYYEDLDQDTYSFNFSGGYYFDFNTISYTPSFGIIYEEVDGDVDREYPYNPSKDTSTYDFDLTERTYGLFWDNDFTFGERWGLKIGGRVDRAEIELEDKVPNKVYEDKTMFSYQIAPSYHFSEKANVYASVGRNYWFPTPRYYAWAQSKGGTLNLPENLEPEEVITWELGYKHMVHKAFNINATIYYSEYNDKFGSIYEGRINRGQGNIGDAEAKGIELEVDGRVTSWFGFRLAATWQDIEWTSGTAYSYLHPDNTIDREADVSGKQIYWVPEFSGFAGFDFYPMDQLKCSVDINYTGKRYVDYLNRIEYPAKTTVDAYVSYTWNQWKFWALGKNIFDEEIEYVSNASGRLTGADGEPDNSYFVQDGAYFEIGVSYRF